MVFVILMVTSSHGSLLFIALDRVARNLAKVFAMLILISSTTQGSNAISTGNVGGLAPGGRWISSIAQHVVLLPQ